MLFEMMLFMWSWIMMFCVLLLLFLLLLKQSQEAWPLRDDGLQDMIQLELDGPGGRLMNRTEELKKKKAAAHKDAAQRKA